MKYKINDQVIVDGNKEGSVTSVHPNGAGVYKGSQHAYYWIHIPSLNYINNETKEYVHGGRAVSFDEAEKRLTLII